MKLLEPWMISGLVYFVSALIGYLFLWMFARGTNHQGQINFKSDNEAVVFVLGSILLAFLIIPLTFYGVLPR